MERGYLLSEPGETEKARETHRAGDRQIETEEFRIEETLKKDIQGEERFSFFLFIRLSSSFSF